MSNYKTLKELSESVVIEKKSKFIGYAKNVTTEDEALSFINEIKKKHWDARHNVYAYSIKEGNISRCSDDGEPSKTAGAPILDVILKNNISNVVIVVTRYFGGILLGTGGLVKAYSQTAKSAIDNGTLLTVSKAVEFIISVSYNELARFEKIMEETDVRILEKIYTEDVTIKAVCKENYYESLCKKTDELGCGKLEIHKVKDLFFGFSE